MPRSGSDQSPRRARRRPGARHAAAPAARRGGVPAFVPLVLLFVGLFVGFAALQRSADGHGIARVDVTRYRLQSQSQWVSPAWLDQLERILVRLRELSADDLPAIRALRAEVEALPFVAEVGTPEVQWPDGLILPLRLHEPVACIPTEGRDFLPVAANGTVLGGYAFAPHQAYGGYLPTLGPHGLVPSPRPGDVLSHPAHVAALNIAESLWRHLEVGDLRRLGRVFIDASREDAPVFDREPGSATPLRLPGGAFLDLEDGRRVQFGRPPLPVMEGELPIAAKWAHLREALGASEQGAPWALLDVRFDEAVSLTRAQVEEFAQGGADR